MDILETMKARHSVRQYKNQAIESSKREKINVLIKDVNAESKLSIQVFYDEPKCFDSFMAHYGKFENVKNYIAIVGNKEDQEKKAGQAGTGKKLLEEKQGYFKKEADRLWLQMKQAEFGQEENIPVPGGWKELLNYLKDFSIRWNADVEKENFRLEQAEKELAGIQKSLKDGEKQKEDLQKTSEDALLLVTKCSNFLAGKQAALQQLEQSKGYSSKEEALQALAQMKEKKTNAEKTWKKTREELDQINRFSKAELTADQVYTFSVRLCDNEVDRGFERFGTEDLERLGELFLGKSGIFDHQWSAKGQTARIYRTEVVREPGTVTAAGDEYCWLKAWAYLMRTEKNQELITEIEGGIKKEVSVGCSMGRSVCSVCGAENGACGHVKGQMYGEKLCFMELKDPKDAYEWSFVAVPAQPRAGVVKRFGSEGTELRTLRKQAELGQRYLTGLRREVVRLAMLADGHLDGKIFTKAVGRLDEAELLELKRAYEAQIAKKFPVAPQLRQQAETKREDEAVFLV